MRITASIFSMIYILSIIQGLFSYVHYELNKDYYAEVLCENKAEPDLRCNGKCQLIQEIGEEQEADKEFNYEYQFGFSFGFVPIETENSFLKTDLSKAHNFTDNERIIDSIVPEVATPPPVV